MAGEMPAAVIENGGTPAQRTLFTTLEASAEAAASWSAGGPALVLIGPAVGRADHIYVTAAKL
jgi:uroporphyrin-III C-methyltransferase/precorrin-2 dehydrogenase/sirohydrochlorin ferrochelatase